MKTTEGQSTARLPGFSVFRSANRDAKRDPKKVQKGSQKGSKIDPQRGPGTNQVQNAFCVISGFVYGPFLESQNCQQITKKPIGKSVGKTCRKISKMYCQQRPKMEPKSMPKRIQINVRMIQKGSRKTQQV